MGSSPNVFEVAVVEVSTGRESSIESSSFFEVFTLFTPCWEDDDIGWHSGTVNWLLPVDLPFGEKPILQAQPFPSFSLQSGLSHSLDDLGHDGGEIDGLSSLLILFWMVTLTLLLCAASLLNTIPKPIFSRVRHTASTLVGFWKRRRHMPSPWGSCWKMLTLDSITGKSRPTRSRSSQ